MFVIAGLVIFETVAVIVGIAIAIMAFWLARYKFKNGRVRRVGEPEAVTQHLDLCARYWKCDFGKLKKWRSEILTGHTPDFGKQLWR